MNCRFGRPQEIFLYPYTFIALFSLIYKNTPRLQLHSNCLLTIDTIFVHPNGLEQLYHMPKIIQLKRGNCSYNNNINGGDVQRKNVVNNVDKSSLLAP